MVIADININAIINMTTAVETQRVEDTFLTLAAYLDMFNIKNTIVMIAGTNIIIAGYAAGNNSFSLQEITIIPSIRHMKKVINEHLNKTEPLLKSISGIGATFLAPQAVNTFMPSDLASVLTSEKSISSSLFAPTFCL